MAQEVLRVNTRTSSDDSDPGDCFSGSGNPQNAHTQRSQTRCCLGPIAHLSRLLRIHIIRAVSGDLHEPSVARPYNLRKGVEIFEYMLAAAGLPVLRLLLTICGSNEKGTASPEAVSSR